MLGNDPAIVASADATGAGPIVTRSSRPIRLKNWADGKMSEPGAHIGSELVAANAK
jgi:hypothetical protein